jgi:hypothetical protein
MGNKGWGWGKKIDFPGEKGRGRGGTTLHLYIYNVFFVT